MPASIAATASVALSGFMAALPSPSRRCRAGGASSCWRPTSWMPTGRPLGPRVKGKVTQGIQRKVQRRLKVASPVRSSPSGASPLAGAVRITSMSANIASTAARPRSPSRRAGDPGRVVELARPRRSCLRWKLFEQQTVEAARLVGMRRAARRRPRACAGLRAAPYTGAGSSISHTCAPALASASAASWTAEMPRAAAHPCAA